jgi:hypothetical protein
MKLKKEGKKIVSFLPAVLSEAFRYSMLEELNQSQCRYSIKKDRKKKKVERNSSPP